MSTWDVQDHYYSGQGVVMLAARDLLGRPMGFLPVGNVSALAISIATTVLEHKESHTGQRGTDLRMTTETKVTLSMTMENFIADNLATSLRGKVTTVSAASVIDEVVRGFAGRVTSLKNIKVANVVVKAGATVLKPYTDEGTAYDYLVNEAAGSIQFTKDTTAGAVAASAVTVGATTKVTVPNTASVGDTVSFTSFTGADAALLNGKSAVVTARSDTELTVGIVTTGKTITTGANSKVNFDGFAVQVSYDHSEQFRVDALNVGAKDLYMRFEGLNTAEENSPVVVEVFKFNTDPLKELALISDAVGQFVLEGSVLYDGTRKEGSNYFSAVKLN